MFLKTEPRQFSRDSKGKAAEEGTVLKPSWKGSVFGQGRLLSAWTAPSMGERGGLWPGPATLLSAHIFRKLFKAFKEDLVHCQNGISNVITSPIIHTLLFSFSP